MMAWWRKRNQLVKSNQPTEEPAEEATNTEHDLSQNESERESEPVAELGEEPEWMQRRIDRFTRKLHLEEARRIG